MEQVPTYSGFAEIHPQLTDAFHICHKYLSAFGNYLAEPDLISDLTTQMDLICHPSAEPPDHQKLES